MSGCIRWPDGHAWARCLTAVLLAAAACAPRPKKPSPAEVRDILARGGPFAEHSFYACLLNGYAQGLPLKQIQADCETKLSVDGKNGFGPQGGDLLGSAAKTDTWFDPASVSGSCNSGDPRVGKGPDGRGRVQKNYADGSHTDWGGYSWGGKGECDKGGCYKGLSEKEAFDAKNQAIRDADKAVDAYKEAKEHAEADPGNKAKAEAAEKAKKAAEEAVRKAGQDPNKVEPKPADPAKPKPVSSTDPKAPGGAARPAGPGETPCEEAVQAAREVLGECQRTGWRHASCQQLWAKMNHCPDPTIMLVDPDAGYACGAKVDPELVRQAWKQRCQQLRRPVPGGPDPCEPPAIDGKAHFGHGGAPDDFCNSHIALIDPESPECQGTLTLPTLGPDIQEILVWALNKIGGPIVFIPNPKPPPTPGPQPRPGPVPN